jgi:predicted ATPase/DNA-binding CsgD family transcriptional regulator
MIRRGAPMAFVCCLLGHCARRCREYRTSVKLPVIRQRALTYHGPESRVTVMHEPQYNGSVGLTSSWARARRALARPAVLATRSNTVFDEPIGAGSGPRAAAPARGELLEREPQLAQLRQSLDDVRATGRGACVLVFGEAGIGKTSLVQSFTGSIEPAHARTLVTGCEALFTARPLGPLVDLADHFPPSVAGALHEGRLWNGLFPAMLAWLREATLPTVLAIEDMHWADAGTLDFVRYAGRRLRDVPVLLLLTYRSDELHADHALRRVIGELPAETTTRIAVPPLSAAAVGALAERMQGARRGLFEATGGNAFFVTEVLLNGASGVPPSVTDAVLGRLSQLSADGRAIAEQVSVFPNQVARSLLERLRPGADEAVDGCLRLGLLVTRGESLAFRHELAREAVLGSMLPHRRAALYAAAFNALRDTDASAESLVRQVHYAEGAGLGDEVARLAPHAARHAAASGVFREAARLYGLALQHATQLRSYERAELLEARAVACMLTSQHDAAIAARREALELRGAIGDRRGEGANLRWLARLHILIEGTTAAFDYARRSVGLLEQLPADHELAVAYSTLAHLHLIDNDIAAALDWGAQAIALAQSLGDDQAHCYALNTVACARLRLHDETEAWSMLERSLALALEQGLDADAARAYNNLYLLSLLHRDFARAAGHAERGVAFCEAKGIDIFTVRLRIRRAFAAMQTGDWNGAEHDLALIREWHAPSKMEQATRDFVQQLLDLRRGRAQAHEALAQTIETMQRLDVRIWFTSTAAAHAEAAWLRGATDVAPLLQAPLTNAVAMGDRWQAGELAGWLFRLGHPLPDPVGPLALPYALEVGGNLRAAADEWVRLGCPYERALVLAGGDAADLREALAAFEALGAMPAAERVRRRLRQLGVSGVQRGPQPRTRDDPLGLTVRERQVFALLLQGLSNAAIAARLHRSERTVENHVAAVLGKTGTASRVELIARFGANRA